MMRNRIPVTLIFDVGKTNKKLFLFDEQYKILFEESQQFEEIKDEDGFPCEDLKILSNWIKEKFRIIYSNKNFHIRAINFSAYGASFVHLDSSNKPLTPLYNYLKPYPEHLAKQFYNTYGGENLIAKQTASPVLGSLNSGLQLYRLKYEQPQIFSQIKCSLHLPQYLSFLLSQQKAADITSVGCHTRLWNFDENKYHHWVDQEGIKTKLPSLYHGDKIVFSSIDTQSIATGIGLHDSSAALIPYLISFQEPFVLISTGTWCISLNPFNSSPLTDHELQNDCLCYLSYDGKPVKAARLFAGFEHEEQVKRLAAYFHKNVNYYSTIMFDNFILNKLQQSAVLNEMNSGTSTLQQSAFSKKQLHQFETYEEAYHQLMFDIMCQQVASTKMILKEVPVQKIFVDGGFAKNDVYMNLLAASFPNIKVYAASISQASALGAALVLHKHVSKKIKPFNLINLKLYSSK